MSKLLNDIYKIVDDKKGDDITVLDFRKNSPFVDYFVICSALNSRMAASIVNAVEEYAETNTINVISKDVNKNSNWQYVDLGSVVVHVFVQDERNKYNLDGLWKDLIIKI